MKKKIGEIYNKPIVEGDKNLVTKNEVHKSELSGSSGGGDSSFEYFSVTDYASVGELVFFVSLIKLSYSDGVAIQTSAIFEDILNKNASLLAIGIDMVLPLAMDGVIITPREFFESNGITDLTVLGWTPITKEEFYSLN